MSPSEKFKKGAALFEQVLGSPPPEKGPAFLRLTVENLFADVWGREGLSIRDRRLITVTILTMMLKEHSLEGHLQQALASGALQPKELQEIMIHIAHYAGWPTGSFGFDTAMKVLQAQSEKPATSEQSPTSSED